MKFKVGDKVRFKKNLKVGKYYGKRVSFEFLCGMKHMQSEVFIITNIADYGTITIKGVGYQWYVSEEMITFAKKEVNND